MNNFLLHRFPMRCNSHQRWTLSPLQKLDRLTALHPFTAVANTRLLQIIRVLRKYTGQNPAAWGAAFKYVWPSDSNKNKSGKRSKRGLGWVDNIKTNPENGHNCHWAATGWSAHGKRLGERFGSLFALFAPPTPRYHLDLEFSTWRIGRCKYQWMTVVCRNGS